VVHARYIGTTRRVFSMKYETGKLGLLYAIEVELYSNTNRITFYWEGKYRSDFTLRYAEWKNYVPT
jgi:hypothetical protein